MHWAIGSFGYFPSYALGVADRGAAVRKPAHARSTGFDGEIAAGRFGGLFEWLRQNVHGQGARTSSQELIRNATGKELSATPWLRYAEAKYLEAPQ